MSPVLVADTRISPLFEENAKFSSERMFSCFEPSNFQLSLVENSHLFSVFKWRILIRIIQKPLENCRYNNRFGDHFSKRVID